MNLYFRDKMVQLIFWNPLDPDERDHIGFGRFRWPPDYIRVVMAEKHGKPNYGFHGFTFGVFEVRYWPSYHQTTGLRS